jgi:hypothetical protein
VVSQKITGTEGLGPGALRAVGTDCEVRALRSVLADRERELLAIKGPCSNETCRLHYAHSGPCDVRQATS